MSSERRSSDGNPHSREAEDGGLDVAIAHKDYDVRGGGEVLAEHLADALDAPLLVGRKDEQCEPDGLDLKISELNHGPLTKRAIDRGGASRAAAYALSWMTDSAELYEFDTVVLSGNEPLWWIPEDDQAVVAYTHSTPRHLYDLFPGEVKNTDSLGGRVARLFQLAQRVVYESNVRRPDLWVANSEIVARRIERYWNIASDQIRVVYPPVRTHCVEPGDTETQDYYFALSRWCEAKRLGEVIEDFQGRDERLLLAGRGPDEGRLRQLAAGHQNIELLGYLSEAEKWRRLGEAKAFIFNARNEDFGIVPIEAMAAGTPVLGVAEGYTQHQLLDGRNGISYERGELGGAISRFASQGVDWDANRIAAFADRFSVESFAEGMRDAIAVAQERAGIDVSWQNQEQRVIADGGEDGG